MGRALCEVSEVNASGHRGLEGSQDAQVSRLPGGGEGGAHFSDVSVRFWLRPWEDDSSLGLGFPVEQSALIERLLHAGGFPDTVSALPRKVATAGEDRAPFRG